jgi:hypothetical protein
MTRLNLLEDQKVILTAKKVELEEVRSNIYVREQQAISDTLLPFFYRILVQMLILKYKEDLFTLKWIIQITLQKRII